MQLKNNPVHCGHSQKTCFLARQYPCEKKLAARFAFAADISGLCGKEFGADELRGIDEYQRCGRFKI
ncbi:hypothetical protein [Nitrosomonas sp.]|uniref:hypothetical protein n=1 Tax=Nitrosomonas sp. TaxID=42353 RepID=UPI0025EAC14D|nr:hypothetical protein [Nitrosomonas sp.]